MGSWTAFQQVQQKEKDLCLPLLQVNPRSLMEVMRKSGEQILSKS